MNVESNVSGETPGKDVGLLKVSNAAMEATADALLGCPDKVLASYGSLRPGEKNHSLVSTIPGGWCSGTVKGELITEAGYFVFLPVIHNASQIPVEFFESEKLPDHWDRLDKFEGENYIRLVCPIETANGILLGNIYAERGYRDPDNSLKDTSSGALELGRLGS